MLNEIQIGIVALVALLTFIAIWIVFYFIPVGLWFSALVSGVKINLLQLFLMRWRRVPPSVIVSSMIEGTKAGLKLDANELEAHYLAGIGSEGKYQPRLQDGYRNRLGRP